MLGRNMEVHMDDMLVKSVKGDLHTSNLRESFKCMRKQNVLHNLTKCAFEIKLGKFVGFMVSE